LLAQYAETLFTIEFQGPTGMRFIASSGAEGRREETALDGAVPGALVASITVVISV